MVKIDTDCKRQHDKVLIEQQLALNINIVIP